MKADKAEIAHIKNEINTPKSRLIEFVARLREAKAPQRTIKGLEAVIGRLEAWQKRK